ncbi:putative membrane protein, putative permease (EamA domain), type 5 [Campylobacter pinnipediorum subsp. pinnipediorum]|uniref:DMT family transporter n=1 Tax=Campylobacter pinnipediorum TaxID=1965231 RepID=UPI0009955CCF|nr:DMT family transporter [Campylobacter pinnipediorum]AQW85006.1 putative membrane protein, putative permease (EamA domain), type 5 [Campylobacter pinnipediorum subsp. pinnipediorum]
MTSRAKELYSDILLFLVAIVWGVTFLPMAKALHTNGVFTILFWRFLIAFLLMLIISFKFIKKADKNSIKHGVILGLFLFMGFAVQTFALKYIPSSTVAFITGLNVVFVPFVVFVFFAKKIAIYSYMGAFLSALGLYFLSNTELGFTKGELLSVICALAYTLHIVLTSEFVKKSETMVLVSVQFLVVAVLSLFCAVVFEGSAIPVMNFDFITAVLVTSIFATVIAFYVQTKAQEFTSPIKTSLIFTFEPVTAGIVGYFIGKENISQTQIMGAFAILFGIIISEIGSYKKHSH